MPEPRARLCRGMTECPTPQDAHTSMQLPHPISILWSYMYILQLDTTNLSLMMALTGAMGSTRGNTSMSASQRHCLVTPSSDDRILAQQVASRSGPSKMQGLVHTNKLHPSSANVYQNTSLQHLGGVCSRQPIRNSGKQELEHEKPPLAPARPPLRPQCH